MGYAYGRKRDETPVGHQTARQLILKLIDVVSRGGDFLLDTAPSSDGGIPVATQANLDEIADWLRPNGEAIYGTHSWKRALQWSSGIVPQRPEEDISKLVDEPPPGHARVEAFFTATDDVVYAILPRWPENTFVLKEASARPGSKFVLLETGDEFPWRAEGQHVVVEWPTKLRKKLPSRHAYVMKMTGVESTSAS